MQYQNINNFQDYWKSVHDENADEYFVKASKLTQKELKEARAIIKHLQNKNKNAMYIIKVLKDWNSKVSESWKAKRLFDTETKRIDIDEIIDNSETIGIDTFKCILSSNACKLCRQKTNNGTKIFSSQEVNKSGYGHTVPWHPNCECFLIPHIRN